MELIPLGSIRHSKFEPLLTNTSPMNHIKPTKFNFIQSHIPTIFLVVVLILIQHIMLAQEADKVFRNAKIYTANDATPFVEAIAIKDGKFIYAGADSSVSVHIGSGTIVEDLNGLLILPGLHDVHMHPLEAGSSVGGDCLLDNMEVDPEELGYELEACSLTANTNGWLMASGHSIFTLYDATRNPKDILDDYYPNDPMVVIEETAHSVWVNSKALQVLGFTASSTDPPGGHIVKDLNGDPNGILLDNAGDIALQTALASNTTIDNLNYDGLVNYSLPLLSQHGITSICEGRTYWKRNYHTIWKDIYDANLLTVRVNLAPWIYPEENDTTQIQTITNLYDPGDSLLRINQIKVYSDGITINATAALNDPYTDNLGLPFTRGLSYLNEARLTYLITSLETVGYDFHIHAIGDRGITEAVNAIENARNTNGDIGARHRVTHLEMVDPTDFARFPSLNITADIQVAGDFSNPAFWHDNDFLIGPTRGNNMIPLKSFHDAGARVTLSSDWDVSSLNPFIGMQNALTRSPQQLPDVATAVKAYTINAAYTMRQEDITGSIEVGKCADFICVNQDIFTTNATDIGYTSVLFTQLNGNEVYRSTNFGVNVPKINNNVFEIFPNPTTEKVAVKLDQLKNPMFLEIISNEGKTVHMKSLFNKTSLEVDLANLPAGRYSVRILLKSGKTVTAPLIKLQ